MFTSDRDAPIYLGTADNVLQSDPARAEEQLTFEHNVLTLLGHRVLVGTPFVWQSKATLALVARNQPLLEGDFPGLRLTSREGVRTAGDYFSQRASDTRLFDRLQLRPESPFLLEQPRATPLDWRNLIGPDVKVEPRIASVEQRFRALVVRDAEPGGDVRSLRDLSWGALGAQFSVAGRGRTEYNMSALTERSLDGHFSRAVVEDEYLKRGTDPKLLAATLARTNALYQLASAAAHGAYLFTSSNIARRIPDEHEQPVLERWTVSPANPYLFAHVLACIGIQPRSWARLGPFDLIRLMAGFNPLLNFIARYREVTLKRMINWQSTGLVPQFDEAVEIFRNDLLIGDRWRALEIIARIGRKKTAPYVGGAIGAAAMLSGAYGVGALGYQLTVGSGWAIAKSIKDATKFAADLRDDISFFDTLRMRTELRRYASGVGLID
ncbi:hypothetical protein I5E68_01535 [Novosphingobium sp. YJ-S2-02]|uniref:Uncharacterized protein n=1 Tax=Novosphingobium aureum TaxID=2792964 RepID=A0A931H9T2_9SPHN|nr:hypothetical protein [Novosphingobium aureum]MBH0111633.1 hypothetical protein [Novosphingobium aureum]